MKIFSCPKKINCSLLIDLFLVIKEGRLLAYLYTSFFLLRMSLFIDLVYTT